jgi:hypothetical protein
MCQGICDAQNQIMQYMLLNLLLDVYLHYIPNVDDFSVILFMN